MKEEKKEIQCNIDFMYLFFTKCMKKKKPSVKKRVKFKAILSILCNYKDLIFFKRFIQIGFLLILASI